MTWKWPRRSAPRKCQCALLVKLCRTPLFYLRNFLSQSKSAIKVILNRLMLQSPFQTNFQKNYPMPKWQPSPTNFNTTITKSVELFFDAPSNYFKLSTFSSWNIHFFENNHFSQILKLALFGKRTMLGKIIPNLRLESTFLIK